MGLHVIGSALHTDHFEQDQSDLWTVKALGYKIIGESTTIATNSIDYMVNTVSAAVTLTVATAMTNFTVYDNNANFGFNNCTVNFGGGTDHVISLDNEITRFYKIGDLWRVNSVGVGNVNAVSAA